MPLELLSDYINKNCFDYKDIYTLPITHITDCYIFEKILSNPKIIPKHCKVLKKDLVYFYYGRPSYSPDSKVSEIRMDNLYCPVCIVYEYSKNDINKIFPFDSGAFKIEEVGYHKFFHELMDLESFELGNSLESIKKYIKIFFDNNINYIEGICTASENILFPEHVNSLINFLNAKGEFKFDDRSKTIEISYTASFNLSDAKAIILPRPFLRKPIFDEFQKRNPQIKIYTYNVRGGYFPKKYYFSVVEKLDDYLNDRRHLYCTS